MKVLQVFPFSFVGGPEKQFLSIARELRKRKIKMDFLIYTRLSTTNTNLVTLKNLCQSYEIELYIQAPPRIASFKNSIALLKEIVTKNQYDGVISSGYLPNMICSFIPVKKIISFHGWTKSTWKVRIYEYLETWTYANFDAIVCVSHVQKKTLLKWNKNCYQINNSFSPEKSTEIVSRGSINPQLKILSIGRLSWEKGFDIAVKSARLLKNRGLDFQWDVYGEGIERTSLVKQINDLDISKNFILKGFITNPIQIISQYDLFVLPSRTEGQSIALLEAMSQKIPIIATNVGGNPDIIRDHIDGLLIQSESTTQLTEAILSLSTNEQLRSRITNNALNRLASDFSSTNQGQKWHEVLQKHIG